ncbi:MAG: hypothetical protein HC888_05135 [Candidatus Competibacteraceae bacterium]|nr:hypothetical protein [Candidatus Competibacteraceae bacterium]
MENTICSTIEHFSEFKRALPDELSQALEQYMMSLSLYPKQVSLSLPQSQQVKTPDSNLSVAAPLDHDQKWLQTELSMEFQRVGPVLEQIKHNLNQYFVLLDWQESPREASLKALYGDSELAISLDFGGWTNTKGRLIELRNSLDVLRVETIRGPHLLVTVSFKQREVLCLAFKYLIYNGRQSWKLLNEPSTLATSGPMLDAAGVADFVRAKVVAFLPGTAHSELFNLELDYVTKDLRLIRLKDSSGNVRGTSLLDNNQLADILQETGLTLDGWVNQPGRGLRIGIVDAPKAKDLGLFGRSLNDRERERIGKAVIQERLFAALIKANESLPSSAFWLDSGTGSNLIINLKSRQAHTFVVSLREIYGMTSDMSISTSIDSKILTFVRNLDPLYSDAMDILARAHTDETLPELLDEEMLAYLRKKKWVKLDPESNVNRVTSQGFLERLNLPRNYVFKNDNLTDEEVLKIAMQLALSIRDNTDVKNRPDYSMYTRRLRKLIESKAQELKLNSDGNKPYLDN